MRKSKRYIWCGSRVLKIVTAHAFVNSLQKNLSISGAYEDIFT